MAQNKTTLILNNLAELTFPLKTSRHTQIQISGKLKFSSSRLKLTQSNVFRVQSNRGNHSLATIHSFTAKGRD